MHFYFTRMFLSLQRIEIMCYTYRSLPPKQLLASGNRRSQQFTISTMPTYYDFANMELGNSRLKAQSVTHYAINIIPIGSRAVTETVSSSSSEIQKRLATIVQTLLESDKEIVAAPAQLKKELKRAPSLLLITAKNKKICGNLSSDTRKLSRIGMQGHLRSWKFQVAYLTQQHGVM